MSELQPRQLSLSVEVQTSCVKIIELGWWSLTWEAPKGRANLKVGGSSVV